MVARGQVCPKSLWRRAPVLIVTLSTLALGLSGCAELREWLHPAPKAVQAPPPPPPATEPAPQLEVEKPKPARRAATHHAKPPTQVAMVDPDTLVGLKPPGVTELLGPPLKTAKDELSLIWTYMADGCQLQIYFYPDLKTADFHVLKYTLAGEDGKALDAHAPCRRKLLAVRDNDTG